MDTLTFIAELVKALAWPLTLAVVLVSLRHSITALIPGLRKLKWKELELEFKTELKEVKADAEQLIPERVQQIVSEPGRDTEDLRLARISPRDAILRAWNSLRKSASKALAKKGYEASPFPQTSGHIGKMLRALKILDSDALAVYLQLSKLRYNVAFHDEFRITTEEAEDYVVTANALARHIESKA